MENIFKKSTPTKEHLFDLLMSVLYLSGFQSVKFSYEHFMKNMTEFKLKSYYFTLNESKIDLTDWLKNIVNTALSIVTQKLKEQPIILSVDDTMVEKYGEKITPDNFIFTQVKGTDCSVGCRQVMTRIFGNRSVYGF